MSIYNTPIKEKILNNVTECQHNVKEVLVSKLMLFFLVECSFGLHNLY